MDFIKRNLGKKTFWAGLAAVASGLGMIVNGEVPTGVQTVILGIGLVTGRDAITKLEG